MSNWKNERIQFMRAIAQEASQAAKDALILKGGTALLLAYKSNRFSEDMDFDAKRPVDLSRSIELAAAKCKIKLQSIILKKDTATTRRYMIHYGAERSEGSYPLKIECSFRQAAAIEDNQVVTIDGMRVYKLEKLAEQKINAFVSRETARDIYDVYFLLKHYPEAISAAMVEQLQQNIQTRGIDALLRLYEDNAAADHVLESISAEEIVLNLEQYVCDLRKK